MCGVSTRRVDQLVESLGLRISKSEVSRIAGCSTSKCRRSVSGRWRAATPTCLLTPRSRRSALAAAWRASASSSRTPCTSPAGGKSSASTSAKPKPRRSGASSFDRWSRGLVGVQLAISDAHPGLKAALAQVLGAPWQRCSVHFLRDCLGHARKDQHGCSRRDPADLSVRHRRAGARAARRGGRPAPAAAAEDRRVTRRSRRRRARLLRRAARALEQAALDQPARALQPRNRTQNRRRRHLSRRPSADPARFDAGDRSQRLS